MSDNQIFKIIPGISILMELLNMINIKILKENISFTKDILNKYNIVDKLNKNKNKFKTYYYKNKFNYFFNNINVNKSISIIRHFLKINNYKLINKNNIYFINKIKKTYYVISFD